MNFRITHLAVATALSFGAAAQAATIGLMAPLSGPRALVGQEQVDGFMLALEQLGVRKFVDKDKVDAIVGLSFSNVLWAACRAWRKAVRWLLPPTPALRRSPGPLARP